MVFQIGMVIARRTYFKIQKGEIGVDGCEVFELRFFLAIGACTGAGNFLGIVDAACKGSDSEQHAADQAKRKAENKKNPIELFHGLDTSFLGETADQEHDTMDDAAAKGKADGDDEQAEAETENAASADNPGGRQ